MSRFVYYNVNPDKEETEDCVTRAIKLATGLEYDTIRAMLELSAEHYECEELCVCCYQYLLNEVFKFPMKLCSNFETVDEVIDMYPNNILLIRIEGHLLCAIDSVIYDLWDSYDKIATCYWICG